MIVTRVEKHVIKSNNEYYSMLDHFCFLSKKLYNHANYIVRKEFVKNNNWMRCNDLDKILKNDIEYPDYKNMPTAQSAQQILRLLDKNWKSFFASIKDWTKNKDKYLGRPKIPSYKKKDGRYILVLTNQNCKLNNNVIKFPKSFNNFTIKTRIAEKENFISLQQVRFIPRNNYITVEVVYNITIQEAMMDNGRYFSIDIGVDNLATITNNIGEKPIVINGKGLKSINQYYNKQISHYRKIAKRMNSIDYTNRMNRLTVKRNNKISDYMHKASRFIIECALESNISVIVIGKNKNWKQKSSLSKRVNQHFVQIPYLQLINQIQYKAEDFGIKVILTEESYTSGTSVLDYELPVKENYNNDRRIHRGLFKSDKGTLINADVNASYQIMKKVFPEEFSDGIKGLALHPIRVNIV